MSDKAYECALELDEKFYITGEDYSAEAVDVIAEIIRKHFPETPRSSIDITLFKKPNDPNERVNKPNYNPPSFEDFDK